MRLTGRLTDTAQRILDHAPDPVVRYRLLREVLHLPYDSFEVKAAGQILNQSRWYQELALEQEIDGGWGRFHSRDVGENKRIPTTEFAVRRSLALGLGADDPILEKTTDYLAHLLRREIPFPDPPEKNDRWEVGKRLFTAATLAALQPGHPALDKTIDLWIAILGRAFDTEKYDAVDEQRAHNELTGATVEGSYLELNNRYTVMLLAVHGDRIPETTRYSYMEWLWRHKDGLGYLGAPLHKLPEGYSPRQVDAWFCSLEIYSLFSDWRDYAGEIIAWLWKQQREDGLWDFGSRWRGSYCLPLSENWRKRINRKVDHSTRVLALLGGD